MFVPAFYYFFIIFILKRHLFEKIILIKDVKLYYLCSMKTNLVNFQSKLNCNNTQKIKKRTAEND